jgi:hypothetical protein
MGSPGDADELRQALLGTVVRSWRQGAKSREPNAGEEAEEGLVMVLTRDGERGA